MEGKSGENHRKIFKHHNKLQFLGRRESEHTPERCVRSLELIRTYKVLENIFRSYSGDYPIHCRNNGYHKSNSFYYSVYKKQWKYGRL